MSETPTWGSDPERDDRIRLLGGRAGHVVRIARRPTELLDNGSLAPELWRWECQCGVYGTAPAKSSARDAELEHVSRALAGGLAAER